jgi:hypothetical protein
VGQGATERGDDGKALLVFCLEILGILAGLIHPNWGRQEHRYLQRLCIIRVSVPSLAHMGWKYTREMIARAETLAMVRRIASLFQLPTDMSYAFSRARLGIIGIK